MGPVLSHTAALRGRKFGGNGRTRVTPPHSLQPPPLFILNPQPDKSNLLLLLSESRNTAVGVGSMGR